jgi:hypothetical protein
MICKNEMSLVGHAVLGALTQLHGRWKICRKHVEGLFSGETPARNSRPRKACLLPGKSGKTLDLKGQYIHD